MSFFARLEARARTIDSLLCVGLDPHKEMLPLPSAAGARDFCLRLIEITHTVALAYKPNIAFFEVFGAEGWSVLHEVIHAVPDEIPVILDAKRGDIASTAAAYAQAAFEMLGADAITLNPYLGYDAVEPFIQDSRKGVFLLCKTSNPSAGELQDLQIAQLSSGSRRASLHVYEMVASLGARWNRQGNIGLVVGATQLQAMRRVRNRAANLWILAPGVGAQGGDLQSAVQAGLREDGMGLIIPVSRGIAQTEHPRETAEKLRGDINSARDQLMAANRSAASQVMSRLSPGLQELADEILAAGCVKFGEFRLKSGLISPIYFDLRLLVSYPELMKKVAAAYLPILHSLSFDRLAALPYAGLPIGTAVSLQGGWRMIYPRKETKDYGTHALVEGVYNPGESVVLLDDLATTGGSKFEAIDKLQSVGLKVEHVVVLLDRQSGARQQLARQGVQLHAVFGLSDLLDHWQMNEKVSPQQIAAVRAFLASGA